MSLDEKIVILLHPTYAAAIKIFKIGIYIFMVYLTKLSVAQMRRQRKIITEYSIVKDIWWNDLAYFEVGLFYDHSTGETEENQEIS